MNKIKFLGFDKQYGSSLYGYGLFQFPDGRVKIFRDMDILINSQIKIISDYTLRKFEIEFGLFMEYFRENFEEDVDFIFDIFYFVKQDELHRFWHFLKSYVDKKLKKNYSYAQYYEKTTNYITKNKQRRNQQRFCS